MKDFLGRESFIKVVFDTIPQWVFVLDQERKIRAFNQAARDLVGCSEDDYLKRCGNVIACSHYTDDSSSCEYAKDCIISSTALKAINGEITHRAKGKIEFKSGKVMNVLVSASPFEYEGNKFSVVIIEDISHIAELQGLIPICASCKKIRDDKGYWNRVEMYIEKHSEAEFTHDICPDCIKTLYPDIDLD